MQNCHKNNLLLVFCWWPYPVQVKLAISKDLKMGQTWVNSLFFLLILCSRNFLVNKCVKYMSKYGKDIITTTFQLEEWDTQCE
jgi:hypothetical protein